MARAIRLRELVERLGDAGVEYVAVGGVAAFLHGSTYPTDDLDVAFHFTRENAARLLRALQGTSPRHAITPDKRPLNEDPDAIAALKNLYIECDLGRIDLLGELPPLGGYDEAAACSHTVTLHGRAVRLIDIDALIRLKEALGRPKDLLVVEQLRAVREARKRPS